MTQQVFDFDALLGPDEGAATDDEAPAEVPLSPTALELDRWGRLTGERIAGEWAEAGLASDADPLHVADAFGALFGQKPALAERPSDPMRAEWYRQLLDSPDYKALHAVTVLDPVLSSAGSLGVYERWATYQAAQPDPQDGDPAPGSEGESTETTLARIRSTGAAVKQAGEGVEEARGLAAGLGAGEGGAGVDRAALAAAFARSRGSPLIRQVMRMAGRMISRARSLQRIKVLAPRGEVTGLELSGDIARLVSSELAEIAGVVPELELLALYRLATNRCLSYKHSKLEPVTAGPLVVGVDESGSMDGERIVRAKALAVALAWVARQQRRWILLYGFSGGAEVGPVYCQPPGPVDQGALLAWAEHFAGGGTECDVSLVTVPAMWPALEARGLQRGKTDHVIITDGIVSVPATVADSYRAWARAEQVRTFGIVLASQPGDLAGVCDRVFEVPTLDLGSECVDQMLGI